ncbi:MAG: biphenyl-2,3-diol 1,2-dioxygenase III-related protein, partial [uncultured Thermomicrobiales bacterium]
GRFHPHGCGARPLCDPRQRVGAIERLLPGRDRCRARAARRRVGLSGRRHHVQCPRPRGCCRSGRPHPGSARWQRPLLRLARPDRAGGAASCAARDRGRVGASRTVRRRRPRSESLLPRPRRLAPRVHLVRAGGRRRDRFASAV